MERILVAGGSGFLGSHLCRRLLKNKKFIYCIDNNITGTKKNIRDLIKSKNFKFIHHDINNPIKLKVDQIYNLACPASPPKYQLDPVNTIKTNFIGTLNLLELAKKNNAKLLQASTSEIYGNPLKHPQNENYWGNVNPIGIRSCYDEGKRASETLCFDFYRQYKQCIKVVRIFNTYGPNLKQGDGRVISNFIIQALKNKNITIFGKGTQTRSFCYVTDLIDGLVKMMGTNKNFIGPINLGNPFEIKIINLARLIIKLSNSKSKIVFKKLPGDDPKRRNPDISLAKKHLSWKPNVSINDGLLSTIKYFKNLN